MSWVPPRSDGGRKITFYEIKIDLLGSSTTTSATKSGSDRSHSADDLTEGIWEIEIRARNAVGLGSPSVVRVRITSASPIRPGPPSALTPTPGPGSVTLSWDPPSTTGTADISHYDYRYQLGRAPASGAWINIGDGTVSTHTVTGLAGGQEYFFQVRARNGNGNGTYAQVAATPQAAVATPGNNAPQFSAAALAATTQSVAENTAPGTAIGSPYTATDADGNTLIWSLGGGTDAASFAIDTSTGQLRTKAALDYETKSSYVVTVRVSDGTDSDTIVVRIAVTATGGRTVPGPVTDLEVEIVSHSGGGNAGRIDMSWAPPGSDGGSEITFYEIKIDRLGSSITSSAQKTGSEHSHSELNLTEGIWEVEIRARNAVGLGSPIVARVRITSASPIRPGPPSALTPTPGPGSVKLSWDPPRTTGTADISHYDYRYRLGSAPVSGEWINIGDGAARTYTVAGLIGGQEYFFQVRARNSNGNGTYAMVSATPRAGAFTNAAPVFDAAALAATAQSVAENTAADMAIGSPYTATDADADDTLTYTLEGTDAASFAIDGTTGQLRTRAPLDHETKPSHAVTVTVSDGTDSATIDVTVTVTDADEAPDAPDAPTVAATSGSATSLEVSWTAPDNTGPAVADYDYRYRVKTPRGSWTEVIDTAITVTSATITGLTASTTYQVQVRAENAEGASAWSQSGEGTVNAPLNVAACVGALWSATMTVGDESSGFYKGYGGFAEGGSLSTNTFSYGETDYVVQELWFRKGLEGSGIVPGYTLVLSVALPSDQLPGFTLHVGGNAALGLAGAESRDNGKGFAWSDNSHGDSFPYQRGNTVSVCLTKGAVSTNAAPSFTSSATASVAENTTAVLTVAAEDGDTGDAVTGYAFAGGADDSQFTLDGTSGALTFKVAPDFENPTDAASTNPQNGVGNNEYIVKVRATSGTGTRVLTADQTITVTVTDANEPPEAPAAPTFATATASTLVVNWETPTNDGRPPIASYDVQYRVKTPPGSWTEGPQDITGNTATITGLAASTAYEVQVRATNDEGDSGWSSSGDGTTSAAANSPATGTVTISDSAPHFGEALAVTVSDVVDGDGVPAAPSYSYQWVRVDESTESDIGSATSSSYTPVAADVGKKLKVRVQFTDNASNTETLTSGNTQAVTQDVSVTMSVDPATIDEGAATLTTTLTVKAVTEAAAAPSANVVFAAANFDVTATRPDDYLGFTQGNENVNPNLRATIAAVTFQPSDFAVSSGGTTWEASKTYTLTIVNDDVDEDAETFEIRAQAIPGTWSWVTLPDAVTVTIIDDDEVPGAPTMLVATPGDAKVTLGWGAPSDAGTSTVTGYEYRQSTDGGSTWGSWTDAGNVLEKEIAGLTNGTEYTFEVRAVSAAGDGAPSAEMTGTPKAAAPDQVTNVVVTAGVEQLAVSWDAVSGASGYTVQWKSGSQEYDATRQHVVTGGTATSYTIPGLTAGTEYTVWVIATKANAEDGAPSTEMTGTPKAAPPDQVTGVSVTAEVGRLAVSWSAVSGADGYRVQWKSGSQEYDATRQYTVTDGATTSYTIPSLAAGTEYTVRVIATRAHAEDGAPSAEMTGTPKAAAPDQVTNVVVTAEVNQLAVSWDAVSGADGYTVQWKSGSQDYDSGDRQHVVTGGSTTRDTIPNLTAGTEYTVRVIATKAHADDGPPSAEMTGTPAAAAPGQVTNVAVTAGVEQLAVSWNAVSGASGYTVQWKSGSQEYADTRQHVTDGATTSYTIPGLTAGTEYTMRVIATRANAADGTPSAEMTGTPKAAAPDQVTNVVVTAEVNQLAVSWDAVSGASGYTVQWKSGSQDYDSGDRQHVVTGGSTTRDTIPNLTAGTEYTVRVIATKAHADDGPPSAEMTGTPAAAAPGQVTNVAVTAGVEQLAVSWNAVSGASGYTVQWKSGSQEYADTRQHVTDGATTSYTIPGLTAGTAYTVRVIATKANADDGAPSTEMTGTPKAAAPDQVTNVVVTAEVNQLAVSWDAVSGASGYTVQWKSGSQDYDSGDRQHVVTGGSTTRDAIPNLTAGTEYTVRVIATKAHADDGPPSAEMTGTPAAAAPGQVTNVAVTAGVEQLAVSWNAVSGASGYTVQWKSGSQEYADTRQHVTDGATTSYTIPGLTAGTAYTVRVIATKANADDGAPSTEMTGTPKAAAPDQVTNVVVTAEVNQLAVSWDAVSGASGYTVQWKSGSQDYDSGDRQHVVTGGSTTRDTIPNLTAGTEYTVRVIATRANADDGAPSTEMTGTPAAAAPGQVTNVRVTAGVSQLAVSWDAVSGASGYTVQWKSGSQDYDSGDRQHVVTGGSTTRDTIPNLTAGTEYTVRVRATRANAEDGAPSTEMTGTPKAAAPDQVTNVVVTAEVNQLAVSWDAVSGVDGYTVQWKSGSQDYDSGDRQHVVTGGSTTRDAIPNLTAGTEYTVRVRATRANADDGAPSTEMTGTPKAATPDQVTNVVVTAEVNQLAVSWDVVSGASGYTVQWKSGAQAFDATRQHVVTGGTATSYTIPGLTAGTAYTVRVIATRAHADDGPPSAEMTGTPAAAAPGQVTNVAVTAGVEQLAVSWNAVSGASGYTVQWKSGSQEYADTRQHVTDGATTSYTIPGLTAGTAYTVRVIATRANAEDGAPSTEMTGTPKAAAPDQVTNVVVTAEVNQLAVSWDAVSGADGYTVQWKSGSQDYDSGDRQHVVTGGSTTRDTIPNLTAGTEYTVRVIATRAHADDGAPSTEMTGTPKAAAPDQVTNVVVTAGVEQLAVSWDAVSGASGYTVQWKSGSQDYDSGDRQHVVTGGSTTRDTIPNLTAGTEYTVRVIATRAHADDGAPSTEMTGTPVAAAPGQVTNVVVTAGVNQLAVSWDAVSGASGYTVQWKSGSQEYADTRQRVTDGATTSYTIPGLTAGTEYTMRVIATRANAEDGAPSAEMTGTPVAANAAPRFTSPATAEVEENTTAVLTVVATDGDAEDDITGYTLTGGADISKFAIDATSGALTFATAPDYENPTGAGPDNTYVVIVQATSGTGSREMTAAQTITVTVTDDDTEAPGAPDAPTFPSATASGLTVNWSAPANAGPAITDYDVRWRVKGSGATWTEADDTTDSTDLTATITGLAASTEYEVQVRAENAEGAGEWSASGDRTTDAAANSPATGTVTISDTTPAYGEALTVTVSDVVDGDGVPATPVYSYQWVRVDGSDADITGATTSSYTPVAADVGKKLKMRVRFTDNASNAETLTSGNTQAVTQDVSVTMSVNPATIDEGAATLTTTLTVKAVTEAAAAPSSNVAFFVRNSSLTATLHDDYLGFTQGNEGMNPVLRATHAAPNFQPSDFAASSGGTTWEAEKSYTLTVVNDVVDEDASETFQIRANASPSTDSWVTLPDAVTVTITDDDEVPGAPTMLGATPGDAKVTLSWDAPSDAGTSTVTGYEYRQSSDGGTTWGSWTDAGNVLEKEIAGLTNGTEYTFEVRAVSAAGDGAAERIAGTPAANAAPTFTSSATAEVEENTTAVLTVVATDGDAEDDITGYTLTGGADISKFAIDATSGALTFATAPDYENPTGAGPDNTYVVIVQATSGAGDRALTATQTITVTVTDDDTEAPGAPDAPTFPSATASGLTVNWSTPTNAGPAITDYDVRWRVKGSGAAWTELEDTTDSTALTATITGLAASTEYEVQVRAENAEGAGEWSASGDGTTSAAADNRGVTLNPTSLTVNEGGSRTYMVSLATRPTGDVTVTVTGQVGTDLTVLPETMTFTPSTWPRTWQVQVTAGEDTDTVDDIVTLTHTATGADYADVEAALSVTVRDNDPPAVTPVAMCDSAQWSATMTVGGESSRSYFGFGWPITSGDSLTTESFSYGGTSYKVEELWFRVIGKPAYRLGLSAALPSNELNDFTLHVGSVSLALTDAELFDNGKSFGWADDSHQDSFPYDRGNTVQVCLTRAASTNAAPRFTSSATAEVEENTTAVLTVVATDGDAADSITGYTLTGGADRSKFAIDGSSGALTFATAPDYENPTGAGPDNVYVVIVQATSGAGDRALTATQTITVTVTDDDTEAPGAPGAPTFPSATASGLTVNWSAPANAGPAITDYDVRWRVKGSGATWTEADDTTDSPALSATITGLAASTGYEVQVRAENAEGAGEWSASGDRTTSAAANSPATGTVTISDTTPHFGEALAVTVSDVVDGDGVPATPSYSYQWVRVDGSTGSDIGSATSSSYTPVAADVGKKLKMRVQFTDDASNAETLTSGNTQAVTQDVSVTMSVNPATIDEGAAALTTTLTVKAVTEAAAAPSSNVAFFVVNSGLAATLHDDYLGFTQGNEGMNPVLRATHAAPNFQPSDFAASSGGTTWEAEKSYTLTVVNDVVDEDASETFQIRANASPSTDSWVTLPDAVTVTITDDDEVPGAPTMLGATPGDAKVTLRWGAPSDAGTSTVTGYEYRQSSDGGTTWGSWTDAGNVLEKEITGLTNGTEYTFEVRAVSAAGDGAPSAEMTGTPTAAAPGQVTNVRVTAGVSQLAVSWDAVSGASGYRVQWKSGSQEYDATRQHVVTGGTATSYTIPGLTAGTEYTVRVRATRANAEDGAPSTEMTGTPTAAAPPSVAALSAVVGDNPTWHSARHTGLSDRPQVVVTFNRAVAAIALDTSSVELTGATLASVWPLGETAAANDWVFYLVPDGAGPIGFTLRTERPCGGSAKGICSADGAVLSSVSGSPQTIPGPSPTPLRTLSAGVGGNYHSADHGGPSDRPQVVVTFNRAVAAIAPDTSSVELTGATLASVWPLGATAAANDWIFFLVPDSTGPIEFELLTGRACGGSAKGICSTDGAVLSSVEGSPSVIPGRETAAAAAPTVTGAALSAGAGGAGAGEAIEVTVRFSEPVTVDASGGTPSIGIVAGGAARRAPYARGSGTAALVFAYTVTAADGAVGGARVAENALALNGGTIRSGAGVNADLAYDLAPAVTGVSIAAPGDDGRWDAGEAAEVAVRFSEAVTVETEDGTPSIGIEVGGQARRAPYARGSGTAVLAFAYTVTAEDGAIDGVRVVENGLALGGGTIRDGSGNNAVLAHEAAARAAVPASAEATAQADGPALRVADARAREGADAAIGFTVTLAPAASAPVTVDWATADGTAKAGEDYTAASGTLVFAPGETEKTVAVAVLDDAHDEGEESFVLRLSNAAGAELADAEAVGTIVNSDHMPKAWLARFGRTVTGHVLDAVEARLEAPRAAGGQATLAGQALPSWNDDGGVGGSAMAANDAGAPHSAPGIDAADRAAAQAVRSWLAGAGARERDGGAYGEDGRARFESRGLTGREFVTGTSFALTGGSAEGGGFAALWGRGALTRFDGREGDLTLDGEVTTGLLGADWATERWTAGLALGHSTGTGGYREGGSCAGEQQCGGRVEATLTGVYPYAGLTLTDRLSVWAAGGYGAGELTLKPDKARAISTDLSMAMGAAGLRSELLKPENGDGLALAVKGDARFTRTSSKAVGSGDGKLEAADADVWLLRTGIEGARRFALGDGGDGAAVTPSVELGVRLDGGDAETGVGADMGGGLAFADPRRGLAFESRARGLIAHEASGFREWGASVSFGFDPRPETERGLALSLTQSWGASPSGGMDALLGRETLAGLAANDDGGRFEASSRLEGELGFGLAAFGGAFTGTPNIGFALSDNARDYRLGWRLTSAVPGDPGFEVSLDATRRETANDDTPAEHGAMLRAVIRW